MRAAAVRGFAGWGLRWPQLRDQPRLPRRTVAGVHHHVGDDWVHVRVRLYYLIAGQASVSGFIDHLDRLAGCPIAHLNLNLAQHALPPFQVSSSLQLRLRLRLRSPPPPALLLRRCRMGKSGKQQKASQAYSAAKIKESILLKREAEKDEEKPCPVCGFTFRAVEVHMVNCAAQRLKREQLEAQQANNQLV